LREDVAEAFKKPVADLRGGRTHGERVLIGRAADAGPGRKERRGHGARFVQVEVDTQTVARGAIDESSQVTEAGLPPRAELRAGAGRRGPGSHREVRRSHPASKGRRRARSRSRGSAATRLRRTRSPRPATGE